MGYRSDCFDIVLELGDKQREDIVLAVGKQIQSEVYCKGHRFTLRECRYVVVRNLEGWNELRLSPESIEMVHAPPDTDPDDVEDDRTPYMCPCCDGYGKRYTEHPYHGDLGLTRTKDCPACDSTGIVWR